MMNKNDKPNNLNWESGANIQDTFFENFNSSMDISILNKPLNKYKNTRLTPDSEFFCKALRSNIYFAGKGKIASCVCKRTNLYGIYPNSSIREAWFGNKHNEYQQISLLNPKSRCFTCRLQILEEDYFNVLAYGYDEYQFEEGYPVSADFELSNKCNLRCIMCTKEFSSQFNDTSAFEGEHSKEIYDDVFLEQLKEFIPHFKRALFIGGEPFLIAANYKIWTLFSKMNPACDLKITTNGTILNKQVKRTLKSGNFQIFVSLDSLHKHNYESIRKGAIFEKTMKNIEYFKEYSKRKKQPLGIFTCFMQQNWHEIPSIVEFCNNNEFEMHFNRVWYPPECALWNSNSKLLHEIIEYFESCRFPQNTILEKQNLRSFESLINQAKHWESNMLVVENYLLTQSALTNNELFGLLENKISKFETLSDLDTVELDLFRNAIENFINKTEDAISVKKRIIGVLNTPSELILTAIYFAGGIDLIINIDHGIV